MSITTTRLAYGPGSIVHVDRFPFEDDPTKSKSRFALVVAINGNTVIVRGIFTRPGVARRPIPAFGNSGLRYDSYLDRRLVHVKAHDITHVKGDTPFDFDPYGDFAA